MKFSRPSPVPLMSIPCKKIVKGKTYDNRNATWVTGSTLLEGTDFVTENLYRTSSGDWFVTRVTETDSAIKCDLVPMASMEQAMKWMDDNRVDIFKQYFGKA
ncbi:MAG TPA: hypothetical protein DET40_02070 [Lentisphaeria bacterium]|nr:MAG: hypothetical protein A2X45_10180 [Lentisphaerae bacterium GWF2_50_93]HCE42319.1 hypothetical protein [Lentisphaeria bacterium]